LGGTLEFRLSIAAYELDDKSRLGLQIAHLSNGGLYHRNPDDNEVLVTTASPAPAVLRVWPASLCRRQVAPTPE
jgi:hypothetical protein